MRIAIWEINKYQGGTERSLIELASFLQKAGFGDVYVYGSGEGFGKFANSLNVTIRPSHLINEEASTIDVLLYYTTSLDSRFVNAIMSIPTRINIYGGSADFLLNDVGQFAIAKSGYIRDWLVTMKMKYQDIHVSQFPIDLDYWSRDEARRAETRKELGVADGELVIGSVGRSDVWKNYSQIYDIVNSLGIPVKYVLCISGHPGIEANFNSVVGENLNSVAKIIHGEEDVRRYYDAMDIFVSCSLEEGLPRNLMEAMAHKLPIVSYMVGGIHELDAKFSISPLSIDTAKDVVMRFAADEAFRHRVGEINHVNVQRFNEYVKNDLSEWFKSLPCGQQVNT